MILIDVFINYQDIWQDRDDLLWYRGPTDDALIGCVIVNPRMNDNVGLSVNPMMAGSVTAAESLTGTFTVEPYE